METLWEKFNAQFENGLWAALVVSALIILIAWLIINLLRRGMKRLIARGRFDATNLAFSRRVINAIIIMVSALIISMQIVPLQGLSRSLLASSGVVAVVMGIAAQQALGNVISGFFLSIFRPFAIGDRIRLMGQEVIGVVEDINLRHTVVRNYDNNRVIVPNSVMNTAIVENAQYHDGKNARALDIRVDSMADVERAMAIVAEEALAHPDFYDNRSEQERRNGVPPVTVRLVRLDETGATLRTMVWAKDEGTGYVMNCDLLLSIRRRLLEAGIALPLTRQAVQVQRERQEP